jgi:hypothetical protein
MSAAKKTPKKTPPAWFSTYDVPHFTNPRSLFVAPLPPSLDSEPNPGVYGLRKLVIIYPDKQFGVAIRCPCGSCDLTPHFNGFTDPRRVYSSNDYHFVISATYKCKGHGRHPAKTFTALDPSFFDDLPMSIRLQYDVVKLSYQVLVTRE